MPRLPRVVIPDVPHHVTQCGDRRMPVLFCEDNRREHLALIASAASN